MLVTHLADSSHTYTMTTCTSSANQLFWTSWQFEDMNILTL